MWDCLVKISTWIESNSGQIQIIIALGAILLAWMAYQKVIKQINLTVEQNVHAASQAKQAIQQTEQMVVQTKISNERSQTAIGQRELAVEQNKLLLQQRASEMKFNIINLIDKNVDSNCQMLNQIPVLLKEFESTSKELQNKNDYRYKIIDGHISSFKRQKSSIEDTRDKLLNLAKEITSQNVVDIDYLEKQMNVLSETLVSSTGSKYDYIIILGQLQDVKVEAGLM